MIKQEIEYAGIPVGIVIPDSGRLKFMAVKFHVHALDGHYFASVDDVLSAISRAVAQSDGRRPTLQVS